MKLLVVGGGGREHAITWKLAQSPRVSSIFVAPGNPGIALEPNVSCVNIDATDISGLLSFAKKMAIDLTIVGPEAPLVDGITDAFEDAGLRCFGPNAQAAQLEGSKIFTKDFLKQSNIPSASYATFDDLTAAKNYIHDQSFPLVIKADGLAAGKGVVIADTRSQAESALESMLADHRFGEAGQRVVIESFLTGREASYMVVADGTDYVPFASSEDHKARDANDKGPNTGGMGAISPTPVITLDIEARIKAQVIEPTLAGLKSLGMHYRGFLYAGLMIDDHGMPQVLEFNCRLGDPETQPLMMRLSSDLLDILEASFNHTLLDTQIAWREDFATSVVIASGGYPNTYQKGHVISGLDQPASEHAKIFHAGTKKQNGNWINAGGRVLTATALGNTLEASIDRAYALADTVHFKDCFVRPDIGRRST